MARHSLLALAAAVVGFPSVNAACNNSGLYPDIVDTSHSSLQAAEFFHGYFTAKSLNNASEWLTFFNPNQTGYYDSTLGFGFPNRTIWATNANETTENWAMTAPNERSYPLRILGDTETEAVVYFVDTPGYFGAEIRSLSSFDFLDGTIRRQLDNWDGRGSAADAQPAPDDQYPYDLGLNGIPENAAIEMRTTASQLNDALSAGNATAAAALFDYDAIFEDLTLRVRVEGQIAIQTYLLRILQNLPYGPGANLTHVLGNAQGGGYEWRPSRGSVRYGITALELDCSGNNITRFTTVWDGSRLNDTAIQALAVLSVTPWKQHGLQVPQPRRTGWKRGI